MTPEATKIISEWTVNTTPDDPELSAKLEEVLQRMQNNADERANLKLNTLREQVERLLDYVQSELEYAGNTHQDITHFGGQKLAYKRVLNLIDNLDNHT